MTEQAKLRQLRTNYKTPTHSTADTRSYSEHWSPLFRHGDSLCEVARLVYIMPSQQCEMVTEELEWYNIHNSLNALINFWHLHPTVHTSKANAVQRSLQVRILQKNVPVMAKHLQGQLMGRAI